MKQKKRNSVFGLYLWHIICLSTLFVLFLIALTIVLKKMLMPYYYEDMYKYVYENFENKKIMLVSSILNKDNDSLDRIVNDKQFMSLAVSKQIRPFILDDYVKHGVFNTCSGLVESFLWGAVCHQHNSIIVELPIKSSDNTLAHLYVELIPNVSAWKPYGLVRKGMFFIICIIALVTVGLVLRFYHKFAKPVKSAVAHIVASQEHLVPTNLKEALPIDELFNLASEIERYHNIVSQNESLVAIGQSTAMMAHDVRRPLSTMKALLSSLPAIKDDPEQIKKMTADVDRSITQTNAMLEEVMDFSRDAKELKLTDHDPQSIITAALGDVLRGHPEAEVRIEYDLRHLFSLHVDGARITRVLSNIIDNAIGAMARGDNKSIGRLWIRTEELQDNFLRIAVADDGPGIPEDVLPKIFDPFFTHGKKGGTGLGLAICQRVVKMHGGRIEARNRGVIASPQSGRSNPPNIMCAGDCHAHSGLAMTEHGAEFIIELPCGNGRYGVNEEELIHNSKELEVFRREEAVREESGDTTNTQEFMRINKERGRQSCMLIVDDEPLFREGVRCLFNEVGPIKDHVKVIEADSAEVGLKIFEGREFDYVIADIDLGRGRMNGYEFAQLILQKHPSTYVLIHSNKRKDEMDGQIREVACHCERPEGAWQSPEHSGAQEIASAAPRNDMQSRFMGFLPKPMRSSELLQFLACKTFEIIPPPPNPSPLEGEGKGEGGRKRILLLNDDENYNLGMKLTLKALNMQVLTSTNVSDALNILTKNQLDGIISDINLGEGVPSGYDFLRSVREKDKEIPFIFTSGYSKSETWPKAKELGATGYLQNPFEIDDLKKVLKI